MMADFYNHRAADVVRSATAAKRQNQPRHLSDDELANPNRPAMPAYWVSEAEMPAHTPSWFLAFSNISSPTNERSMVAYPLPMAAVGHSIPLILCDDGAILLAVLSSFALDYSLRQKLGGVNLTYNYVQQLPVLSREVFTTPSPWYTTQSIKQWVIRRVAELVYTSFDMAGFAADYELTDEPYEWNPERRELLRAELDAAFFHLYGIERDDVDYIMETFQVVKRKNIAALGEYRTKRMILEIYDAMAEAEATGVPYESQFDDLTAQ